MIRTRHYVFLLVEEFTHLAFANAVEPLRIANLVSGQTHYTWSLATEGGTSCVASSGLRVAVDHGLEDLPACAALILVSGLNVQAHVSPRLKTVLRRARARGQRLGAVCSGAYILAATGLLDGQKAAIHWQYHDTMAERFPNVTLARSVFVADGPVLSASGGAATADLMLHLIARDHGEDLSLAVSEQMVYSAVRDGSAEQKVSHLALCGHRSTRLAEAIRTMRANLEDPLATSEVARRVGVTPRQLERLFAQYLNKSPRRFMMELRLDRARALLVQTDMSVIEVGLACGFTSSSHFARVFRDMFGHSPTSQKRLLL